MTTEADIDGPANARRLLGLFIRSGVAANEPMQSSWVQSEALRALGLRGDALDAALTYAGSEEWIDNGPGQGTIVMTDAGVLAGEG